MSTQELVLANDKTPQVIANDFLSIIKDIEICIDDSTAQATAIENRGLFKSLFSSTRSDLINISRSQNKINEMMLGLIQEVITLNVMSYSFLAAVISEMQANSRDGWVDSEGKFQKLSETGQQFADRANDIFVKILEGSKSTQNKIEVNQQNIAELKEALKIKAEMVLQNKEAIADIKNVLTTKAAQVKENQHAISTIQNILEVKAERLNSLDQALEMKNLALGKHDEAIRSLLAELQENNRLDIIREQKIQEMQQELETLKTRSDQLRLFSYGLSGACVVLAVLLALNIAKVV